MNTMLSEIKSIPEKIQAFLENTPGYSLPLGVPYLGMGSSYFAPLAFKYMGIDLVPELASEFYNYMQGWKKFPQGVLLSQSGKSSEVVWCASLFDQCTVISNDIDSPLCKLPNLSQTIQLMAGEEKYSSSKTYINTLLALFKGFRIDVGQVVQLLQEKITEYENQGKLLADSVYDLAQKKAIKGLYITGSGPNIATALQASLILSESTKLSFNGIPMSQYDHGPKETARDSIVIQIAARGKSYERTKKLSEIIEAAGAHVFTVEEPEAAENDSILTNIIPFNFMAYYLSAKLKIDETFIVGTKVTEVK